jgi:hypothetical protein
MNTIKKGFIITLTEGGVSPHKNIDIFPGVNGKKMAIESPLLSHNHILPPKTGPDGKALLDQQGRKINSPDRLNQLRSYGSVIKENLGLLIDIEASFRETGYQYVGMANICCTLAHYRLWKHISQLSAGFYLVLEDDFISPQAAYVMDNYFQTPQEWIMNEPPRDHKNYGSIPGALMNIYSEQKAHYIRPGKYLDEFRKKNPDFFPASGVKKVLDLYSCFNIINLNWTGVQGSEAYLLTPEAALAIVEFMDNLWKNKLSWHPIIDLGLWGNCSRAIGSQLPLYESGKLRFLHDKGRICRQDLSGWRAKTKKSQQKPQQQS